MSVDQRWSIDTNDNKNVDPSVTINELQSTLINSVSIDAL